MRIEDGQKLDFSDVLIRPKRSTLGSRADVDVQRSFVFLHTGVGWEGFPLIAADVVKVGIGPGSVCTTRKLTGVGYPQLSAIIECADAAHGLGGQVCADGGCTSPGDIAKALGGGADFVMLGGMLAGHDECDGEL